jgi:hypothetical protein
MSDYPSEPPEPQPFNAELDRLRQTMQQYAGPEDSPPVRVIHRLLDLTDSLQETQRRLAARLADAGLEDVVRQAARRGIDRAAIEAAKDRSRRRSVVVMAGGATLLCAGAFVGFQVGMQMQGQQISWTTAELQQAFRGGIAGAHWLATVAASNDLAQPAAWCADRAHQVVDQGGTACYVPVWIKAPPAKTP